MNKHIRQALCDLDHEEAVLFDNPDFDDAVIGYTEEGRVIYDYDKMVKCYMEQENATEEEAIAWIEYNTMRSLPYVENAPIVMYPISQEVDKNG